MSRHNLHLRRGQPACFVAALAGITVALIALAAIAQAPADDGKDPEPDPASTNFGAIAIHRSGAHVAQGWTVNWKTQAEADARALRYCGGDRCEIVLRFQGLCAAYAEGALSVTRPSGKAIRRTQKEAEAAALKRCNQEGDSCKIIVAKCNKRG